MDLAVYTKHFESMTMGGVECIMPARILLKESVHVHYYDNAIPKAQAIPISNFRSLSLIAFILCAFKKKSADLSNFESPVPGRILLFRGQSPDSLCFI